MTLLRFQRTGTGKPVILIHGFLGGSGVWVAQQAGLREKFDVLSVDLPGFAGSPIGSAPKSMRDFAFEVVKLADSFKFQQFSLVGWSFGGMIAQQAALDHPERIDRLVLAGTAAVGELPHRFETWSQTLSRISTEGLPQTLDRTIRTWFVSGDLHPFHPLCRKACDGATEVACRGAIEAIRGWRSIERLPEIKQPTLVIVGDRDRSTPLSESVNLLNGLPAAQLCVLPGCAHGAHMEKPEYFNKMLIDFLSANV